MAKFFWHNLSDKEIVKTLRTDVNKGLDEKEIIAYQKEFGKNKLPEEKPLSTLKIFLEQFQSPLIYILVVAGFITLVLKQFTDSLVIWGAVFLNVIVGFIQENKSSKTLKELKKTVKHETKTLRRGVLRVIDSLELVPGDIILLSPGDKVPADARIVESNELKINEIALTGEWLSAQKQTDILPKETPLADRNNMIYTGTVVEDGKAKAVVVETGSQTEIGKIALFIKESKEEKTPYQKKLANFSKTVGIFITIISIGIFFEGVISGGNPLEMFITAIAVAVAAIPEGLPVAMTVILALGMRKILKKGGLVRKLSSTETLGSTTIICTDKTATLTEGTMMVARVITPTQILNKNSLGQDEALALKIASFCSEAFIENPDYPREKWILRGRPTDKALLRAGIERGLIKFGELEPKKISELPFSTINKFIATLFRENKTTLLYVSGAPERIIERCQFVTAGGRKMKLTPERLSSLENKLKKLTGAGLRVVASAYKQVSIQQSEIQNLEKEANGLVFAGFITLKDPVRKEVKDAIKTCRQAGLRPIIVTGDHKLTAQSVAKDIGFKINKENILEGKELDALSDRDFEKILDKIKIYARVEPKHKTRIVEAWQERGEVVAMTGDGINDAPALKRADIGVALGSGTEVAKETADLILLNDSFSIIIKAIQEGRAIVDNIRKVIVYLLSDSFTEVVLITGSMLIAWLTKQPWVLPITAAQILWLNLIEDGLPDIALAFEPEERDLMKLKPAGHKIPLLTREMKTIIFIIGIITDLMLLGLLFWLLGKTNDIAHIRTMIFATLSVDSLFYVFSCKSLRRNLWEINPFSNKFLVVAFVVGILMLVSAIYVPFLQSLLKTVPLAFQDWLVVGTLGFIEIVLIEATKWYFIARHETEF